MDRRTFIKSALAVIGAVAGARGLPQTAEALPVKEPPVAVVALPKVVIDYTGGGANGTVYVGGNFTNLPAGSHLWVGGWERTGVGDFVASDEFWREHGRAPTSAEWEARWDLGRWPEIAGADRDR